MNDVAGSRQRPECKDAGWRQRGRAALHLLWLIPAALATVFFVAWFTWISPYGYQAPPGLAAIDPDREHRVFVYGTLRQPLVRRLVTGQWIDTREATLPGFARRGLDLERTPGASTPGETFVVDARVLARLDRYERLGIRYRRMQATLSDGKRAWVYRRLPADE
ncbi:MAG: gamma-glutamylcyclotransferase family protein, partial [Chromatocurvus sp.]